MLALPLRPVITHSVFRRSQCPAHALQNSQKKSENRLKLMYYCMILYNTYIYLHKPSRPSESTCIMHDLIRTKCQASHCGLQTGIWNTHSVMESVFLAFFFFFLVRMRSTYMRKQGVQWYTEFVKKIAWASSDREW